MILGMMINDLFKPMPDSKCPACWGTVTPGSPGGSMAPKRYCGSICRNLANQFRTYSRKIEWFKKKAQSRKQKHPNPGQRACLFCLNFFVPERRDQNYDQDDCRVISTRYRYVSNQIELLRKSPHHRKTLGPHAHHKPVPVAG
mgnify:CR=1 FL=1